MNDRQKLLRLRVELYTAAQTLRDDDATLFWGLIDELQMLRGMRQEEPAAEAEGHLRAVLETIDVVHETRAQEVVMEARKWLSRRSR